MAAIAGPFRRGRLRKAQYNRLRSKGGPKKTILALAPKPSSVLWSIEAIRNTRKSAFGEGTQASIERQLQFRANPRRHEIEIMLSARRTLHPVPFALEGFPYPA